MEIAYAKEAREDLLFWQKSGNKAIQKKISDLIESIELAPFKGIGKPEPLKHDLSGAWSRRIDGTHRLVYRFDGTQVLCFIHARTLLKVFCTAGFRP